MLMEIKTCKFESKSIADDGSFEGYVSVFGVPDDDDDIVEKGAFARTLKHWQQKGAPIPHLYYHDPKQPIGGIQEAYEDDHGLYVKGKLELAVEKAREVHALMKAGVLRGLSFGYKAVKAVKQGIHRHLKEVRLFETTSCTFPLHPDAGVTRVKSARGVKRLLPLAEESVAWDADAAEKRVWAWAYDDGADSPDWKRYARAFLWHDAEAPASAASHKLPFADVIGGKLVAVPRAIYAAAGALGGARGGVDIPEGGKVRVRRVLARYYEALSKRPPWESGKSNENETEGREVKMSKFSMMLEAQDKQEMHMRCRRIGEALSYAMHRTLSDDTLSDADKLSAVDASLADHHKAMLDWAKEVVASKGEGAHASDGMYKAALAELETKAGKVLSAHSRSLVKSALEALQALLDNAGPDKDPGEAHSEDGMSMSGPGQMKSGDPEKPAEAEALHSLEALLSTLKGVPARGAA